MNSAYCPPVYEVPRDAEGFIKAFDVDESEEMKEFFDKFGFVVVKKALNEEECKDTIDDIWNYLKIQAKIDRNDEKTWENDRWSRTGLWNEGIIGYDPIFTKRSLLNRQNPNIYKACSIILNRKDLMVNNDRYGLFRATKDPEADDGYRASWFTDYNLHLDMNPWNYLEEKNNSSIDEILGSLTYKRTQDFITENNYVKNLWEKEISIQCLINLADNREEDGGFQLVPGFNHHLVEWAKDTKERLFPSYGKRNTFIVLPKKEPFFKNAIRITARAGSIVIWNQTVVHGSRPNMSNNIRYAQFFRMFPAIDPSSNSLGHKRWENRKEAVKKQLEKLNFTVENNLLTPLGMKLFGLELS